MSVVITATGPTALRTFTFPDANATILTSAAAVTVPQGGTGLATLAAHGVVIGEGASAVAVTSAGTAGQALISGGASADPAFGSVGVAGGGTGVATLTARGVVIGEGTSAVAVTAAGATGLPLVGAGASADPAFAVLKPAGGGVAAATVTLTDGATPALDASLGTVFRLAAGGDRTIGVPTNPTAGQKIVIQHYASGAARTLALNSGAGGFRFGSDITALSQTASGKTDYIGAIYNDTDSKWDVVAFTKGF